MVSASVSATLDIGIGQISAKIRGYRPNYLSAYISQNASYRVNIGQNENIGIGVGGRYVGSNISVSAKISAPDPTLYDMKQCKIAVFPCLSGLT